MYLKHLSVYLSAFQQHHKQIQSAPHENIYWTF